MAYRTRCPECQAKLTLDEPPDADEAIECPKCGNQFTASEAPAEEKPKKDKAKKDKDKDKDKPAGKKKDKSKDAAKDKGGKPVGPVKRKLKQKKTNPVVLYLMAAGALVILVCVGIIGYFMFGRVNKVDEMLSRVPAEFNLIRGMNVGLIARYPGYMTELKPQFERDIKDVAAELATAAGENDPTDFVDYAVHAKKREGSGVAQVFVIRTRNKIDGKAVGAKLGAETNVDGTACYRATGRGLMNNALVFSPNNRLLVVITAGGQQDAVAKTSVAGSKAKENTLLGKLDDAGKKIVTGHIWVMVQATGDLSGYISGMGEGIKRDFSALGNQMGRAKFFGTWLKFGTSVKVGAGVSCDTKESAKEVSTAMKDGPLGKGDDSEVPNETKKVLSNMGNKEFKSEFLANIAYSYTGACAFFESRVNFEKAKQIIQVFNKPMMGDAAGG